jgi:hypothetical protein
VLNCLSALCQHYLPVDRHLVPAALAVGLIAGVVASQYGNRAGAVMGVGEPPWPASPSGSEAVDGYGPRHGGLSPKEICP